VIRHALRLVWNRKRSNALILLEIFFSFLVVFAIGTLAIFSWANYRRPLGFDYDNVWSVSVSFPMERAAYSGDALDVLEQRLEGLLQETRSLDFVEKAAITRFSPFQVSGFVSSYRNGNRSAPRVDITEGGPGYGDVLKVETVRGRWFRPEDKALAWTPVVIDQDLATALFGQEDPLGRRIREANPERRDEERRVMGVVRAFRVNGEFSMPRPAAIELFDGLGVPASGRILVRVRPGTPPSFEEKLVKHLQAVARDTVIEARPVAPDRATRLQARLVLLAAGGLVASFLLAMVALGLVGVLWQNLIRRTREIGLRRAAGASRMDVQGQLLAEQLVLTTLGISLAVLLAGQLPLTGVLPFVPPGVFAGGLALAAAIIYVLTALCAFYPSWMASRIPPAEALRYE
jgi:putative ABC transport system permease protein